MLLLNVDPTLSSFHHATAVQGTEAKPVVDMVTASVDRPSVFLGVGDARRLDDDVLDVAPCQIPAENTQTCLNVCFIGFFLPVTITATCSGSAQQ